MWENLFWYLVQREVKISIAEINVMGPTIHARMSLKSACNSEKFKYIIEKKEGFIIIWLL